MECRECVDGYSEFCYFDSRRHNKSEFSNPTPEDGAKEKCFGVRTVSLCGNCFTKYEIMTSEGFKEVSCEEFFRAIETKNNSCGGCLEVIGVGCC